MILTLFFEYTLIRDINLFNSGGLMNKIELDKLNFNPFERFSKDWCLITAGTIDNHNTMTASWGTIGIIWNKNIASIYIRPQRYTNEFVENNEQFTLSFFDESYREALVFCGKKSGRDFDKDVECKITPVELDKSIGYEQANLVIVCNKLYSAPLIPENFITNEINEKCYPNNDQHIVYYGEIISVYEK